jgi:hypothetical protein
MNDPDLGVTLPEEVLYTTEFIIHPLPISKPPSTMVFRALSGFGVGDRVAVRDAVGLAVRVGGGVGVRLAVNVAVRV